MGKENFARLNEKFGISSLERKAPVIWLHAASLGETNIALNLAAHLGQKYPYYQVLITNGTKAAAEACARSNLSNMVHQYVVADIYFCVQRFLKFWQPKLAIFIESEIWPNIVDLTSKTCPIIIVNGSLSQKSFRQWSYCPQTISKLLAKFSLIITKGNHEELRYKALGAKEVVNLGNFKFSNERLKIDTIAQQQMSLQTVGRRVIVAASTHEEDEELACACYLALKEKYPNLLLIIVPRHLSRIDSIIKYLASQNLDVAVRSKEQVILPTSDVYLADTMGELGLFYSLAHISIIGGSLKRGSHNIIEPSTFNTAIIFGPDVSKSRDVAEHYLQHQAAAQFHDLAEAIKLTDFFLQNPQVITAYSNRAAKIVAAGENILPDYIAYISRFIENDC